MQRFVFIFILLFSGVSAFAAPMTFKELDFLLRQRTPENDIVGEVAQRRLVAPIDDRRAQSLKQSGATDALLARLQAPAMFLSPAESRAELERVTAQQQRHAPTTAPAPASNPPRATTAPANPNALLQFFGDHLVKLDGDNLRACAANDLNGVHLYAIYYASMQNAACRRFTPQLIRAYAELKAKYPEMEVIFVSRDVDEFNMALNMRTFHMPWPAVRWDALPETIRQFGSGNLPWLIGLSDAGQPLTTNVRENRNLPPEEVLEGIRYLLQQVAPNR